MRSACALAWCLRRWQSLRWRPVLLALPQRPAPPPAAAAAEDRAGAGVRADLARRRAGHARGLPRQGGRRDLHSYPVHGDLPRADPDDVVRAGSARGRFGAKIAFVSITVDPERDTPDVLKEYAQAFGANFAGWSFLTGTPRLSRM